MLTSFGIYSNEYKGLILSFECCSFFKVLFSAASRDSFVIIPNTSPFVNTFFHTFFIEFSFFLLYNVFIAFAPVAQWIEHRPPEPGAWVRFPSGVPFQPSDFYRKSGGFFFTVLQKFVTYSWQKSKQPGTAIRFLQQFYEFLYK